MWRPELHADLLVWARQTFIGVLRWQPTTTLAQLSLVMTGHVTWPAIFQFLIGIPSEVSSVPASPGDLLPYNLLIWPNTFSLFILN